MRPHQVPSIAVADLPADVLLLDVREDDEWRAGHIEGALHVPMYQVPQQVQYGDQLAPERPVVVVCKVGGRSAQVTAFLTQHGFDAANLEGGMLAWAGEGRPMISEDGQPARVA